MGISYNIYFLKTNVSVARPQIFRHIEISCESIKPTPLKVLLNGFDGSEKIKIKLEK